MSLPLFLAIALVQASTSAGAGTAPPAAGALNFGIPPNIAEIHRIELTPALDGKIEEEEWDPLSVNGPVKTYLQWEPGVIYAAATGPAGQDMLVSLDMNSDGWLVGNDNIEARVSGAGGKPTISVRQLDATNVAGPLWRPLPGFIMASQAASAGDASTVTYELKLVDPGLGIIPDKPRKISARIDLVPSSDQDVQAFMPRALSPVELVSERAAAMPEGLHWGAEHNNRSVAPGDSAFIRLTFNSKTKVAIKKLDIRCEGPSKDQTNQVSVPFPAWDNKGRAFVDYTTRVDPNAEPGYRVLRGTLTAGDGTPAVLETSFRIAPIVDFGFVQRNLPLDSRDRSLKCAYYVDSNTSRLVRGQVSISTTAPYRILNDDVQKFTVAEPHGRARQSFELFIPASSTGPCPLTFKVEANGKTATYVRYVNIG